MVFGFMSLGGILYLSTLPLGNAQPGQCSLVDRSLCRGYNTSRDGSGPRPWCCNSSDLICTGNDYKSDTNDPYDPTYNNTGTCNTCTHTIGDDCNITSGNPCCAGLYCDLSDECQPCVTPGEYCYSTTPNTPGSCCPWGQDGNNAAIQYACINSYCIACSGQNAACDSSTHCCDGLTCDPYSSTCQYCSLPQYDTSEYSCNWWSAEQQMIRTKECCGNLTCYPVDDTKTIYGCLDCVDDYDVCDPSIADVCCGDDFNCATVYATSNYMCQECSLENATCSTASSIYCCDQMSCYPDSQDTWRCTQCTAEMEECNNLDLQPCCGTMECFLYSSTQAPLCMNCTEGGEPCDDTVPDCCEGFDCLAGYCQPCIDMGVACNPNFTTSCCDNGTCYYNSTADGLTCQNCTDEYETCDPSGTACCGNFSCSHNTTSDTYSCQHCIPVDGLCVVDDVDLPCCGNLTCYNSSTVDNTTCQDCLNIGVTCTGQNVPECCGELYCTNSTSTSADLNCANCIQTGISCTTNQTCCSEQPCGADGICPASPNGALSLFSTNISLKQLVGFAVVMMAAGIL